MDATEELTALFAGFEPGVLADVQAYALLRALGISAAKWVQVTDEADLVAAGKAVGYPLVMKIDSPQITHKSDVGGVQLGIANSEALQAAHAEMMERVRRNAPKVEISGVMLQEQLTGVELAIGGNRDAQFGPLVMVGVGGVAIEVYRDVAFRVAPFEPAEACEAIGELAAQPLLDGFRGGDPIDRKRLAQMMVAVGNMMVRCPQIKEIDINPLVATGQGLRAVDARVVVGAGKAKQNRSTPTETEPRGKRQQPRPKSQAQSIESEGLTAKS